jgi:hypothetical protein
VAGPAALTRDSAVGLGIVPRTPTAWASAVAARIAQPRTRRSRLPHVHEGIRRRRAICGRVNSLLRFAAVADNRCVPGANEVEQARDAILALFRWSGGHADVWPVFADPAAMSAVVRGLAAPFVASGVTKVAGLEARGFLLGGAVVAAAGANLAGICVMVDQLGAAARTHLPPVTALVTSDQLPTCAG